tara:strand:- start:331 stop:537 length:207 start_codon:yes stop_codon:yes gene_type:complete
MNNRYKIPEIIDAINILLEEKIGKKTKVESDAEPLVLTKQVNKTKKYGDLPKDTEKIILEAEKYLKKT